MENTQIIAERIKKESKKQDIAVKTILENCNIDKNIVNKLANGKDTGTQTIIKIADYLNCSVDYLLGRCDNPNVSLDTYINGNNNGIQAVKNGTVNITPNDEITKEISSLLSKLNFRQKTELMGLIYKFVDENK